MAIVGMTSPLAPDSTEPLPKGWGVPLSLLLLAGPIIATMISRTVMNFVDFIMVSRLGTEAQAAILPAGMSLFSVIAFGMGALTVTNTFVSQSLGRGEPRQCSSYTWQGIWLGLGLGLMLLPLYPLVPGFFEFVGHAPAVVEMERVYVQIGLLSVAPMLVGIAVTHFFNGIHRPAVGFWSMLVANVFNVAGNYALIFGNWGFAAMGVAGAAWATTLAAVVQTLIVVGWWLRPACHRAFDTRGSWRLHGGRLWKTLKIGTPIGLHFTVDIAAFTLFTLFLVGRFGTIQLAAHNLAFKLLEVSFMPTAGLGIALTAAVGKAIGRGQPRYARLVVRWGLAMALLYMCAIAVCFALLRHQMPWLLIDPSDPNAATVAEWAATLLLFCAAFQVFDAMNLTFSGALRGAGDTAFPAFFSMALAGVVLVGGGYLIAAVKPQWGAAGPWAAATVYIVLVGLMLAFRWWWGPWERIDLLKA